MGSENHASPCHERISGGLHHHHDSEHKGGHACSKLISTSPIGNVPPDSCSHIYAPEKADRLASHSIHISSWQSRDLNEHKYGGAIRVGEFGELILSFSGLPEHADEALVLMVASDLLWTTREEVRAIVALSDNPFISADSF